MRTIASLLFFLAAISTTATAANAEPDNSTKFLMKRSASLFTWGMHKIEHDLSSAFDEESVVPSAKYNYAADEIRISLLKLPGMSGKVDKARCRFLIDRLRQLGGVNPGTGNVSSEKSVFARHFAQTGYEAGDWPENIGGKIDQKVFFKVSLYGESQDVQCQAPFLGTEVTFRD